MAIRRADLSSRLAEAEKNLARVAEELAVADRELQTVQSDEQLVQVLLDETQADLARLDQTAKPQVSVSLTPRATPVPPAPEEPKTAAERLLQRVVDAGRNVLSDRPAAAVQVSDGGALIRAEAVRRRGELTEQIASLHSYLDEAGPRSGAATAVVAAKAEEWEGLRSSSVADQEALAAALAQLAAARAAWGSPSSPSPSALALAGIPPGALELYRDASASCPGLSWTVLAAIGHIESWHGRSLAPGVHEGENFAGAMGPMQFLAPTWTAYGMDGNGDGVRDPYNHADAVHGAASYLCAKGAADPPRLPKAIWHYNHADWYVRDVLDLAARYGGGA